VNRQELEARQLLLQTKELPNGRTTGLDATTRAPYALENDPELGRKLEQVKQWTEALQGDRNALLAEFSKAGGLSKDR